MTTTSRLMTGSLVLLACCSPIGLDPIVTGSSTSSGEPATTRAALTTGDDRSDASDTTASTSNPANTTDAVEPTTGDTSSTGEPVVACREPTDSDTAADATTWSRSAGGGQTQLLGRRVAVDPTGAVVVADRFSGQIDLGGGSFDIGDVEHHFVTKYAADGAYQWHVLLGGPGGDIEDASFAIDCAGEIFVVGSFRGLVTISGAPLVAVPGVDAVDGVVQATTDGFYARFTADGALQWARSFGDEREQRISDVVTTDDGIVIVGHVTGLNNIGGASVIADASLDGLVAGFDRAGDHTWHRSFPGSGEVTLSEVTRSAGGLLSFAGTSTGTVDLGGGALEPDAGAFTFVAQLGSSGAHRWSRRFLPLHELRALAGDVDGSLVITGARGAPAQVKDMFVVGLDPAGATAWSRYTDAGRSDAAFGRDLVIGGGEVVVVGGFHGALDFGGGVLTSADPGDDIFVARYDLAGHHLASEGIAGSDVAAANGVAFGPDGELVVTGEFAGVLDLGAGPLSALGQRDRFTHRFAR